MGTLHTLANECVCVCVVQSELIEDQTHYDLDEEQQYFEKVYIYNYCHVKYQVSLCCVSVLDSPVALHGGEGKSRLY